MSNRQFKTLLSKSRYILYDYGDVSTLPQLDQELAGVCKVSGVFYIKHRNSNSWSPLIADKLLLNVNYNTDASDENHSYFWIYKYEDSDIFDSNYNIQSKKCTQYNETVNHLFVWKHNQHKYVDCSFFRALDHRKINIPYLQKDNNIIIADFTGFDIFELDEFQTFYIIVN